MADQTVEGIITPTGDLPLLLIGADNPQGFVYPFGSVTSFVTFEPPADVEGGLITQGTITPVGDLEMEIRVDCFPTTFECVTEPITDYDCVSSCEDIPIFTPPNLDLGGVIIPVGVLTFGPPPLVFEGMITPTGEVDVAIPCPTPTLEVDVVPDGVHAGDLVCVTQPSSTPAVLGSWTAFTTVTSGWVIFDYMGDNTGMGVGSGSDLMGTGWIRMLSQGSFLPPGRTVTFHRLFSGFTPGVTYYIAWKYNKHDVFNVLTQGVLQTVAVADGSGNVLAEFVDAPAWSGGILTGEAIWFERILIYEAPPCPDNLDGG